MYILKISKIIKIFFKIILINIKLFKFYENEPYFMFNVIMFFRYVDEDDVKHSKQF
jgi:hypothetical protein